MGEEQSNTRSLSQHRFQARRLRRRAIYEALAVIAFSFALYVLIHEGLHTVLKIICGFMLVTSAANGLGDYYGYKKRLETIRQMQMEGQT